MIILNNTSVYIHKVIVVLIIKNNIDHCIYTVLNHKFK